MAATVTPAARLRATGVRATSQRQAILATLAGRSRPLTAQAVHTELAAAGRRLGLSTVYRCLHLLAEAGLLHAFDIAGERSYRLCAENPHQHLLCDHCGRVAECPPRIVQTWLADLHAATGFTPDTDRIDLHGTCALCARPSPPHRARRHSASETATDRAACR